MRNIHRRSSLSAILSLTGLVCTSVSNASAASHIANAAPFALPGQLAYNVPFRQVRKPRERLLYSFSTGADGGFPITDLSEGARGVLYGSTLYGGTGACTNALPGCGTVFEMIPVKGGYRENVIYDFQPTGGSFPNGLMLAPDGALYGTTATYAVSAVLFGLTPGRNGFGEHLDYQFPDLIEPWGDFASGPDGAIYGTIVWDSKTLGQIVSFDVKRKSARETVLYTFKGGQDGLSPVAPVTFDKSGTIYGATSEGGGGGCLGNGCGTLFKLTPGSGGYTETVLYRFTGGADGSFPSALIEDKHGHLFGVGFHGGNQACIDEGCGVVFEFDPSDGKLTVLYDFVQSDLWLPDSRLVMSRDGVLYGTTSQYGPNFGFGGVFSLTPSASGYVESDVHVFTGNPRDGYFPRGGLTLSKTGKLFGTTYWGGTYDNGTVFEMEP